MNQNSPRKHQSTSTATRLQVTRRLSFSTVPDAVFRLRHLRAETRLVLAWALGRPTDWEFNVGHICHELGITEYRWRHIRAELIEDGWMTQYRDPKAPVTDDHGNVIGVGFRWTLTITDAPLVNALTERTPTDTGHEVEVTTPALNTTDEAPDDGPDDDGPGGGEPRPTGEHSASFMHAGRPQKSNGMGSNQRPIHPRNGETLHQKGAKKPNGRKPTDAVKSASVDSRIMRNSTHASPYKSNQDDDDDVSPQPPNGDALNWCKPDQPSSSSANAEPGAVSKPVAAIHPPATDSAPPARTEAEGAQAVADGGGGDPPAGDSAKGQGLMPVGDIQNRILAEGFRQPQVISDSFLGTVKQWRDNGLTPDELEDAITLAHRSLGEGHRPRGPNYYRWAVERVFAQRAIPNAPTPKPAAANPPAAQATTAASANKAPAANADTGSQRWRFDNATVRPRPLPRPRHGSPHPEDYRALRTDEQRQREINAWGFCREDYLPGGSRHAQHPAQPSG